MNYLGVDPGSSGSLTLLAPDGAVLALVKASETLPDIVDALEAMMKRGPLTAAFEKVSAFTGQGAQASFIFGRNTGDLRGILAALRIPCREVSPVKWQREFVLPSQKKCGGSKTVKKNHHKARAQELFPRVKITHAFADSLLIAEWLRRQEVGGAPAKALKPLKLAPVAAKRDPVEDLFG